MYPKLDSHGDMGSHQVPLQMECESPEECNDWLRLFRKVMNCGGVTDRLTIDVFAYSTITTETAIFP